MVEKFKRISGIEFNENVKSAAALAKFDLDRVSKIIAIGEECGDWADVTVAAIFLLTDGNYAILTGSCDTTGWDCQASAEVHIADSEDAVMKFATPEERRMLAS